MNRVGFIFFKKSALKQCCILYDKVTCGQFVLSLKAFLRRPMLEIVILYEKKKTAYDKILMNWFFFFHVRFFF